MSNIIEWFYHTLAIKWTARLSYTKSRVVKLNSCGELYISFQCTYKHAYLGWQRVVACWTGWVLTHLFGQSSHLVSQAGANNCSWACTTCNRINSVELAGKEGAPRRAKLSRKITIVKASNSVSRKLSKWRCDLVLNKQCYLGKRVVREPCKLRTACNLYSYKYYQWMFFLNTYFDSPNVHVCTLN